MEMKKYKLGELTLNITDGEHGSVKQEKNGSYYLLNNNNITEEGIVINATDKKISETDYKKIHKRTNLEKNDLVIATCGTLGKTHVIKDEIINYEFSRSVGIIKCNSVKLLPLYLHYYFKNPVCQTRIKNISKGGVQKHFYISDMNDFDLNIPEINEQRKIISILSSLDDKIALNNRINAKLEQMAKRLYDYWFVQFDFPGADGKPYKSNGGKMVWNEELKREIPEGWEVKKLGDVTEIVLGGTPSTQETSFWNQGTINWLNSGEVGEFPIVMSEKKITESAMENSSTEFLKAGSVTLSITRYLRPSILAIDACINQSVVGLKENELLKNCFMYPYLQNEVNRLMSLRTGAQQPHINKETVERSYICIPPKEIMTAYNKIAQPIYNQIINIAKQSKIITEERDKLLPLLMNGQVVVE